MIELLWMVSGTGGVIAALFFFRVWRDTKDRFFLLFASAFLALGVHWSVLAVLRALGASIEREHAVQHYGLRLVGFLLILAAIIDKNR